MMRRLFLVLPLLAAGCTVGPDYHRPAMPGEAAGWATPAAARADQSTVIVAPWQALGDTTLDALIAKALAANSDIAEAKGRLREARALLGGAQARGLPSISASADAQQTQVSLNGQFPAKNIPNFDRNFPLFDAGFDASWEIDLWGGNRRGVEAARGQLRAAQARATDVRLQVVAEVARTYAQLRAAQTMLASARTDAEAQAKTAALVEQRYRAGEASAFDNNRAAEQARSTAAAIPGLEADARAAALKLGVLTGQPPEAMQALADQPAALPAPPANVAVGARADMLRRRPDISAAEADLAAATANIGVETANLYPRLSLTGSFSQQARTGSDLFSGDSFGFSVGPRLKWAIFDFGQVRAQIKAADARADQAAARYTKAVLNALADSETAINRYAAAQATLAARDEARARSRAALDLARQRYQAGEDDLLALLSAQSAFTQADRNAASAHEAALEAYIALVKALGGGWSKGASSSQ
jgi:NodT family efflux transporter outer membrane factor (OMF) lipoprotein